MTRWQKNQGGFQPQARPVADLVSKLLDPVIERRAGMTMDLIAVWDEIAGEDYADHSMPEKLAWPRQAEDDAPFEPATLIVACDAAKALFLQHDGDVLIKRINTYFGFTAVARLKLVQRPIKKPEERSRMRKPTLNPDQAKRLGRALEDVDDPHLKAALEKLGRGVFSSGSDAS